MFKTQRMSLRSYGENAALTCRGKVLEALVHVWEGKCFGVPEGGENITKSSGDVPKRWGRGLMEGLASAVILRAGNPLRKELERGLELEKWDMNCHRV